MKISLVYALLMTGITATLLACSEKSAEPVAAAHDAPAASSQTEQWLGQWNGPEGTFLRVEKEGDQYKLTIQNLDGPRSFVGVASGDTIQFTRDGVQESIHASNGADTGMKWLSEKTDCLTVRSGEGYCRN